MVNNVPTMAEIAAIYASTSFNLSKEMPADETSLSKLQRWEANTKEAIAFWANVKPSQVCLSCFGAVKDCGTIACFGGHLAAAGKFGVMHYRQTFSPLLIAEGFTFSDIDEDQWGGRSIYQIDAHDVAEFLFGCSSLFWAADSDEEAAAYEAIECPTPNEIDHWIVVQRLQDNLNRISNCKSRLL